MLQKELLSQRKVLLSNNIEFEQTIELPAEEALQSMEKAMGAQQMALQPMGATGGGGVSGAEVKKLETQISQLKAAVASKEKELSQARV